MAPTDRRPATAEADVRDAEPGDGVRLDSTDPGADGAALGRRDLADDLYWTGKRWIPCPRIDASDAEWYAFADADRG